MENLCTWDTINGDGILNVLKTLYVIIGYSKVTCATDSFIGAVYLLDHKHILDIIHFLVCRYDIGFLFS